MPLFEYNWIEVPGMVGPFCRSRSCRKAHYRDKEPKRRMVALQVQPHRKNYYSFMWFCNHCKRVLLPNEMQDRRSYEMIRDPETGQVIYRERGTL